MNVEKILDGVKSFDATQCADKRLVSAFAAIGMAYTALHLLVPVRAVWRTALRPRRNHFKAYGGGWAMVTGASAGIGLNLSFQLASQGFNIILVGRSEEKLVAAAKEIEQAYKVQTKIMVFDFSILGKQEAQDQLEQALQSLNEDISLLVNNVGTYSECELTKESIENIFTLIHTNATSQILVSRTMLPKFIERFEKQNKRSAVINISSMNYAHLLPSTIMFSATKAFNRTLSIGMSKEYKGKIDVLTVTPSSVKTERWNQDNNSFFAVEAQNYAKSVLDRLGWDNETPGHWKHDLQFWLKNTFPFRWFMTPSVEPLPKVEVQVPVKEQAPVKEEVKVEEALPAKAEAHRERTFVMVKPDGVQRGKTSEIIKRFERKGFKLVALKLVTSTREKVVEHYGDLKDKPFFERFVNYCSSGPVTVMVWEGNNVIMTARKMLGTKDPATSNPATIRGDLAIFPGRKIIGSSDPETLKHEMNIWFEQNELIGYENHSEKWIYE